MAFWAEEQKRAGERRGLGGLAAEPDPPRPETRGPTQHHRALNAEVASPASRNRTWGRTRMRLKEPAPPGYFCARMRRPLRFRNRTPSATSLRSLRRGLRRETEQSCRA